MTGMSLFRQEVVHARRGDWLGTIRLPPPRLGWLFVGLGLAVLVAIALLLFLGRYTRHEQVDGTLVPGSGVITLRPVSAGVVTNVLALEGRKVRKGDPLIEISSEQASASLGNTSAAIISQLRLKRARLESDIRQQQLLASAQRDEARDRAGLLKDQLSELQERIALQQTRAESAEAVYEQWSKLSESGVVSKLQVLQQRDVALEDRSQVKELRGEALALRQQISQLQSEQGQQPAIALTKVNEIERQLADVDQSLSQSEVQRALVLRAPTDGTIASVLVQAGQTISASQALVTLLPGDASLQAELWVSSRAVGFITRGNRVMLRYQAYPYQKFGQQTGVVTEVSRSALPAADLGKLLGQDISEPRYRVRVALDRQAMLAYGEQRPLEPGMALDADVLFDQRRLLDWVLDPLYGFNRSVSSAGAMR